MTPSYIQLKNGLFSQKPEQIIIIIIIIILLPNHLSNGKQVEINYMTISARDFN